MLTRRLVNVSKLYTCKLREEGVGWVGGGEGFLRILRLSVSTVFARVHVNVGIGVIMFVNALNRIKCIYLF